MLEDSRRRLEPSALATGFAICAVLGAAGMGGLLFYLARLVGQVSNLDPMRTGGAAVLFGIVVGLCWLAPKVALPLYRTIARWTAETEALA